jgi:hypothetical protein
MMVEDMEKRPPSIVTAFHDLRAEQGKRFTDRSKLRNTKKRCF